MTVSSRLRVGNLALYSRILVILMQSFFNFLIPDHNAKVFSPPNIHRRNAVDYYVEILLGGFLRWDGIYFLHIAEFGYTYENTLAFFPLYPLLIRVVANSLLLPLQYCMNYTNVLLITAVLINIISFVETAKCLCNLTFTLFGSEQLALKVVQIFCLNPASVFFSAPYSEVTYSLFAFNGMLQVERNHLGLAACYFALSGATRSNGLLNVAFIWHRQLRNFISILSLTTEKDKHVSWGQLINSVMQTLLLAICYAAVVITPFMAYQYYASKLFCNPFASYSDLPVHVLNYGNTNHYKMPHTGLSSWCRDVIPLSYSYVQKQHWGLGFLAYYQLKQVPNFLLALPVVIAGFASGVWFLKRNPHCCVSIGVIVFKETSESDKYMDKSRMQSSCCFYSSANFVYTVHMLSLIVFGILYMHVQVLTRLVCCSCPAFYSFLACVTTNTKDHMVTDSRTKHEGIDRLNMESCNDHQNSGNHMQVFLEWENSLTNRLVYIYLHLYFFVGIAAFSNFLPWT